MSSLSGFYSGDTALKYQSLGDMEMTDISKAPSVDTIREEPQVNPVNEKETPKQRGVSFTKSKRTSKKKGRFSVKVTEANDQTNCDIDCSREFEDGSSSPIKKLMRTVSIPMKGRFQVKTLKEKPNQLENGEMSPGIDTTMDTRNQMTLEAVPQIAYYRNQLTKSASAKRRPTLKELHGPKGEQKTLLDEENVGLDNGDKKDEYEKFGWIKGVLVRCLLNIWGVMLFLRLTWIVGQAGIVYSILIILMSTVVTVLTTLSMSAICTNGEVKGGGAYYMISRSLGPEFGGSIGLIFSLANAIAVAMYVVGFAETVRDIMVDHGVVMVDPSNDVRIIGEITVVFLLGITLVGMSWEAKAQMGLLVILLVSLVNMVVGTVIPPTQSKAAQGFLGYKGSLLTENVKPDFRGSETFFSVFSIFFPAATGILAGANISGDLKDAQQAIPKGTLWAILITSTVYAALAVLIGACVARAATGDVADLIAGNVTSACSEGVKCKYGLLFDFGVAELISGYGPIVYAGIFAATLSSALASLVSAPKVFQAVCKDKIFPRVEFFAKGVGPADDPKRAFVLAFVIAVAFIAIGELNAIAPLISNFFLMSYALINFSCFSASLAKSPGWRPSFRYYNMWGALVAAGICVGVMFLINWWAALVTIAIVTTLYMYVKHTKPEINWGSSNQAFIYKQALQSAHKLSNIPAHVKTFRPQLLVLSGHPECRPALVHFCSHITKGASLLLCGNVITGETPDNVDELLSTGHEEWLANQKIKAFPGSTCAPTLRRGVQSLLQLGGIGKIRPNTVVMGYKHNWQEDKHENVDDYVGIIHDTFDIEYGLCILRIPERFDVSSALSSGSPPDKDDSKVQAAEVSDSSKPLMGDSTALIKGQKIDHVIKSVAKFQSKMPKGSIDVWWLTDDGGLTLLIPHLLTQKSNWEKCYLRVFTGGVQGEVGRDEVDLVQMLTKFRIDNDGVHILKDINKKPQADTMRQFQELLAPWVLDKEKGETEENFPWKVTPEEIESNKDKTKRHLRIWELLHEHSEHANLIVITLPMPRIGTVSPYLYMCWLEMLTKDLPPILLMRGNQKSVLTYYS